MSEENGSSEDVSASSGAEGPELTPMDFSLFVLSLNTSALMQMGQSAVEGDDTATVNLPLARQSIDILAMLEGKTNGNLTGKEEQLLHQVLFDLRMRFAKLAQDDTQT